MNNVIWHVVNNCVEFISGQVRYFIWFLLIIPSLAYSAEIKPSNSQDISKVLGEYGISDSGFTGPFQGITDVTQALNMSLFGDDLPVSFVGNLKSSLGGELYLFTDGEEEIAVEIKRDKWRGQSVNPTTKIHISGELDKSILGTKVDVSRIVILSE